MAFIRYLLVGVVNTLVGLGTIYFAMYFLGMRIAFANAAGYLVGILVSFILNRNWTFGSQGPVAPSFLRFLLVLVVGYVANLVTVLFVHTRLELNAYVAQAIGIVPYTAIGFLGSRYFVFGTHQRISSAAQNEESETNP